MNHCQSHDASTVLIQMSEFIFFVMHAGVFQNCPNIKVVPAPDVVVAGLKGRKRKSNVLQVLKLVFDSRHQLCRSVEAVRQTCYQRVDVVNHVVRSVVNVAGRNRDPLTCLLFHFG